MCFLHWAASWREGKHGKHHFWKLIILSVVCTILFPSIAFESFITLNLKLNEGLHDGLLVHLVWDQECSRKQGYPQCCLPEYPVLSLPFSCSHWRLSIFWLKFVLFSPLPGCLLAIPSGFVFLVQNVWVMLCSRLLRFCLIFFNFFHQDSSV